MTEKDAVKCAAFAGAQHWYVPVSACFDGGESSTLLNVIINRIEKRDQASQGPVHG
jgi:tetraacyldisaccharide 4'-kinase